MSKFLTMFNFQLSQINQQEFERLIDLLLKYHMVYATSNLVGGQSHSPLQIPLKNYGDFKKQRASKVPIHLQDKVKHTLKHPWTYLVKKEQQPKRVTIINIIITVAKEKPLKIV